MATRRTDVLKRLTLVGAFLGLSAAAVTIILTPTPEPWKGVYVPYAPSWVLLGVSAILVLVRIERGLAWPLLLLWGLLFAATVGAFSLQWGWVYGFHDPWAHYGMIQSRVFDLARNVYPAFHIYAFLVGLVEGVKGVAVLRYVGLLATSVGVLALGVVLRTLPYSRRNSQRAFVATVPVTFLAFIPRPFTLAWPFALFIAWGVFTAVNRKRAFLMFGILGVALTVLHPQVPTFAGALLFAGIVVAAVRPYVPASHTGVPLSFEARQLGSLLAIYAGVVVVYFFGVARYGQWFLDQLPGRIQQAGIETPQEPSTTATTTTEPTTTEPTTTTTAQSTSTELTTTQPESENTSSTTTRQSTPGQSTSVEETETQTVPAASGVERRNTKVSFIGKIVRQPALVTELLARLAYIIALGGSLMVAAVDRFRDREYASDVLVTLLTTAQFAGIYLFADLVLHNTFVGAMRVVKMLPLVLVPGVVYALRSRNPTSLPVAAVMALLVLTAGLGVAYPSAFTGATFKTATDEQVAGVDWAGEHARTEISGTGMTFWIMEGRFGKARMLDLGPGSGSPKRYVTRRLGYSWQLKDPLGLVVVDGYSRSEARLEAAESGDTTALADLETMPLRHSRVYSNGGTDIYGNKTVAGG